MGKMNVFGSQNVEDVAQDSHPKGSQRHWHTVFVRQATQQLSLLGKRGLWILGISLEGFAGCAACVQ